MSDDARGLLREAKNKIAEYVREIGGCDHSVGVCCCEEYRLITRITAHLAAPAPDQWVKCSEMLPGLHQRVRIVCDDADGDKFITHATLNGYKKKPHFVMDGGRDAVNATHWQPLPPLPKEEK